MNRKKGEIERKKERKKERKGNRKKEKKRAYRHGSRAKYALGPLTTM